MFDLSKTKILIYQSTIDLNIAIGGLDLNSLKVKQILKSVFK